VPKRKKSAARAVSKAEKLTSVGKRVIEGLKEGENCAMVIRYSPEDAVQRFARLGYDCLEDVYSGRLVMLECSDDIIQRIGGLRELTPVLRELEWLLGETRPSRLIFDPNAGNALGVEVPLGGILHGPPGSGKTLLARVLAGETGRRLLAFDGGALTSMWRGESTQLIRDMFMQARDCTPCILFIDELDGVLPSRASLDQWGQDSAQRINQFLQELEGVSSRLTGVFVLGATNHLATIDSAVRSRLSYHVEIPLPDYQAREAILSKHFPSKATTTPAAMAKITEGLSGRTLRELCRIAGMIALSEHAEAVTADHFHRAVSRVKDTDNVG